MHLCLNNRINQNIYVVWKQQPLNYTPFLWASLIRLKTHFVLRIVEMERITRIFFSPSLSLSHCSYPFRCFSFSAFVSLQLCVCVAIGIVSQELWECNKKKRDKWNTHTHIQNIQQPKRSYIFHSFNTIAIENRVLFLCGKIRPISFIIKGSIFLLCIVKNRCFYLNRITENSRHFSIIHVHV